MLLLAWEQMLFLMLAWGNFCSNEYRKQSFMVTYFTELEKLWGNLRPWAGYRPPPHPRDTRAHEVPDNTAEGYHESVLAWPGRIVYIDKQESSRLKDAKLGASATLAGKEFQRRIVLGTKLNL